MRSRRKEKVSPTNFWLAWVGVGCSHLGTFSHCKAMQTCGRKARDKVTQLPFGADRRQATGRGYPGCTATPALPWHPLPPCGLLGDWGSLRAGGPAASTCRGRPGSATRPLPSPPPAPPFSVRAPAPPGPSKPLLAQPPPKPGEVESRRRRSLRGTRGAALGMLSRPSLCWSQVGSSCAAPAADPGAPGRARLKQSCRAPQPSAARTAGEPAFLFAFAPDLGAGWGVAGVLGRDPGSGGRLVAARTPCGCSSPPGPWATRSLPPAQPQPQLQQLPPHLQRTPAAESCAPCARAAGRVAGRLRAHSLTSIPPATGALFPSSA